RAMVRAGGVCAGDWGSWRGNLEHGDQSSFLGDADLVYQGFYGCLTLDRGAAGGDDLGQVAGEGSESIRVRSLGRAADDVGELVAAGLELGDLGGELAQARAGGDVVHGAVLERGLVAADGCLFGGDLRGDRVGLGLSGVVVAGEASGGAGD